MRGRWSLNGQYLPSLKYVSFLSGSSIFDLSAMVPQANIKLYSLAFVLSPLIKSYRGKTAESVLVCVSLHLIVVVADIHPGRHARA